MTSHISDAVRQKIFHELAVHLQTSVLDALAPWYVIGTQQSIHQKRLVLIAEGNRRSQVHSQSTKVLRSFYIFLTP